MNIVETLTRGIEFEIKVSKLFKRMAPAEKGPSSGEDLWKEIIAQKEKQIHLLKKIVSTGEGERPIASRIKLLPAREMEEGFSWISQIEEEFKTAHPPITTVVNLISKISSSELRLIYSPLIKVCDLKIFKKDPELISLLNRHYQSLNLFLKRNRASSLNSITEPYPFLVKKEDEKKGFREEELYQNLLTQKKAITLHLRNGDSFSGKLDSFDHFSLICSPRVPAPTPIRTLFLKEAILTIQIDD